MDGILTFFSEKVNNNNSVCEQNDEELHALLREDEDSDSNTKNMRAIEGTTLLHIMFAVRRDQELGREFIKYLKVITSLEIILKLDTSSVPMVLLSVVRYT